MNPEDAAFRFAPDIPQVKAIIDLIVERVQALDPGEAEETRKELDGICRHWDRLGGGGELLYGRSFRNGALPHLMHRAEELSGETLSFPTLNSLRDVEGQSGLFPMPEGRR
jgi:hypothetical protein